MIQYRQQLPNYADKPFGPRGGPSTAMPTITTGIGNSPSIADMAALRH